MPWLKLFIWKRKKIINFVPLRYLSDTEKGKWREEKGRGKGEGKRLKLRREKRVLAISGKPTNGFKHSYFSRQYI
jgi:hypothetical protein